MLSFTVHLKHKVDLLFISLVLFFNKVNLISDTESIKSSDSDNASMGGTMPRAGGVKNVFEGAWQRAQQQDEANEPVASPTRQKSVWMAPKKSGNNNWWDLGEDPIKPPVSPLKGNNRLSSSSSGSHGSLKSGGVATPSKMPPPPPSQKPKKFNPQHGNGMPPPPMMGGIPPPPMNMNNMPPPPMNDMPPPPPMDFDMPPPPMSDMPPPPGMDDMPPPPPMNNMPPPPSNNHYPPGLPPALRNHGGAAPIRLPALPLKPKNYNYNNNHSLPLMAKTDSFDEMPPSFHPPTPGREDLPPIPGPKPKSMAPLSNYYNTSKAVSYKVADFPPPPEFVVDLNQRFNQVVDMNLPPPPSELLVANSKPQR